MTVAALVSAKDYLEDGVSLNFPCPFRFRSPENIAASRVLADGSVQTLTYGVHYSVTGGATDAGGTLTLVSSIAGSRLRIRRVTPRAQSLDYATGDNFPAETHELGLDTTMLIDQEQDDRIADTAARAVMLPDGELQPVLAPLASRTGGGKILAPNATTGLIEVQPIDGAYRGPTGPSANSYASVGELRAAPVSNLTALQGGKLWFWTAGNFTTQVANDPKGTTIIASNAVAASLGAWVAAGFNRPAFTQADPTAKMLVLDGTDDFVLAGLTLKGNLVSAVASINWTDPENVLATETETGLELKDNLRSVVRDLTVREFKKYGVHFGGTTFTGSSPGDRGVRAMLNGIAFYGNTIGLKVDATNGANEYLVAANLTASGNQHGADISGGNVVITASNFVDNFVNLRMRGGYNHGHGIISACQFNHTTSAGGYLCWLSDITNGQSFIGNHWYAFGAGGQGPLYFQRCGGILQIGEVIDAWTYYELDTFDVATKFPYNRQDNCYLPGDSGPADILSLPGSAPSSPYLIRRNCFGKGLIGTNGFTTNDPADLYVNATQKAAGVAFVDGDFLKFPTVNAIGDRRQCYNAATGLITVPRWMGGQFRAKARFVISGAGLVAAGSYCALFVDGAQLGPRLLPQVWDATEWVFDMAAYDFHLAELKTIGIKAVTINGTTKLFGIAGFESQFTLEKIA